MNLEPHPADFLVGAGSPVAGSPAVERPRRISRDLVRVTAVRPDEKEQLIEQARRHGPAHPVYVKADTGEELLIGDRIVLDPAEDDAALLSEIARDFQLVDERRMGSAHILRLGPGAGMNPLDTANRIADLPGVRSCHPEVLVEQQYHSREPAPR